MNIKEYNKTWHYGLWFTWGKRNPPKNLVCATPIYIFGRRMPVWICKLYKKNYLKDKLN